MTIPKHVLDKSRGLTDWAIITAYRGSIAHGMYVPKSNPDSVDDKDIMSICVPPIDFYLGFSEGLGDSFPSNGTKEIMWEDWDVVIYEARKFIHLLAKGNPNVLAMLWLEDRNYINMTDAGRMLIENRNVFVGKHVYNSFTGYAYGQLHRMEAGGKYQGHASAKRKELVARYGYDTKNAAHLVRLLRMGIEFLTDGELYVQRKDASQLLEIKRGEWPLEKIKAEADRLFQVSEQAYINSKLPVRANAGKVNRLCVDVIQLALSGHAA